jgi:hypothetical protein
VFGFESHSNGTSVTADEVMTMRFMDGTRPAAERIELVIARAGSTISLS